MKMLSKQSPTFVKTCNSWKTFISVPKTSTQPQKKIFSVLRS